MNILKKKATLSILLMVSMGHLLNDMFQSVIPLSLYSLLLECTLHFMQSRCRIAVSLRATIEDNNSYYLMTAFTSVIMSLCASSGSDSFEVSVTLPALSFVEKEPE